MNMFIRLLGDWLYRFYIGNKEKFSAGKQAKSEMQCLWVGFPKLKINRKMKNTCVIRSNFVNFEIGMKVISFEGTQ